MKPEGKFVALFELPVPGLKARGRHGSFLPLIQKRKNRDHGLFFFCLGSRLQFFNCNQDRRIFISGIYGKEQRIHTGSKYQDRIDEEQ